ncbi:ABC transporter permease [Staphylococcus massiliensis]|uniref:Nitrate/sulfonate/bicarbinate ABC transporter permease n=1 Tax=Staphylococcus massiliensis S46 TaxID=1229783 RepID=K9B8Y6_9STAP|nr:ABC transporter permease [Staphylococcus massiliensis]EKU50240.1 nitrate/sulfonate/bicarbinate ABC transporter permease [Staphylococcus massiliensis S46]MCG3399734.1 ABC transporter permease [Staphylococcus massiliensis]MCG3400839.1 ABC transporter permease [Staphylococcus massiliensis]MCG3411997.1 ABC transporter permease [Staphylococcus massiliensis]PNZ99979.1 ABC transporter permease [Staphylococcus massiliensis CCUG 55927]
MTKSITKITYPIIALVILVAIWQLIVVIGNYPPILLPSPILVGKRIITMLLNGEIIQHIGISLFRFVIGFIVALIVAILSGFLLTRSTILMKMIEPLLQIIRPISPIAWAPFIVLWFGIGNLPAIVIIFIAAFFPIVFATIKGLNNVDAHYLQIADNLNIKGWQLYKDFLFPGAFKHMMSGIHVAVGTSWIFLVSGEMIGAQSGLGFLIMDSRNMLNLEDVLVAIFYIGIIGFIIDRLITLIENQTLKHFGE